MPLSTEVKGLPSSGGARRWPGWTPIGRGSGKEVKALLAELTPGPAWASDLAAIRASVAAHATARTMITADATAFAAMIGVEALAHR